MVEGGSDSAARGRAIFERLRTATDDEEPLDEVDEAVVEPAAAPDAPVQLPPAGAAAAPRP